MRTAETVMYIIESCIYSIVAGSVAFYVAKGLLHR